MALEVSGLWRVLAGLGGAGGHDDSSDEARNVKMGGLWAVGGGRWAETLIAWWAVATNHFLLLGDTCTVYCQD